MGSLKSRWDSRSTVDQVNGNGGSTRTEQTGPALLQLNTQLVHEKLHVFPDLLLRSRIAEQIGRMIRTHHPDAMIVKELTSQLADSLRFAQQILSGHGSPADDIFGLDRMYLRVEKLATVRCFLRQWIPIARRSAAQDVANVKVFAFQLAGFDDPVEQLSGRSDEGFAPSVFFGSGCFTNKHDPRIRISDPKHGLRSFGGQFRTALAAGNQFFQRAERVRLFLTPGERLAHHRVDLRQVFRSAGGHRL